MLNTPRIILATLKRRKLSPLRIATYAGAAVATGVIICAAIFVVFLDPLLNSYLKNRISQSLSEAYPALSVHFGTMHYNLWDNRLTCDTITLSTIDSSFSSSLTSFTVDKISWMSVLWHRQVTQASLSDASIGAQDIVLHFPRSSSELRIGRVHVSVHDSAMTADATTYHSLLEDDLFFARSRFRQTRFRLDIPCVVIKRMNCLALLDGNTYEAGSIHIQDASADILVNMDRPYKSDAYPPMMPNELFASLQQRVAVDSVIVSNARLNYGEKFTLRGRPGRISFHNVSVLARGIANRSAHPDTARIDGKGLFMNTSIMKVHMTMPLTTKEYSLQYSGSLESMEASVLNAFIEPGEHHRITSGIIHSASYHITIASGRARGTVRAAYEHLGISILNKKTGSARGIWDRLASLYGRIFIIRRNNMPDSDGTMKIGIVRYTRGRDDVYFQNLWFGLRSGVADVVGLPLK